MALFSKLIRILIFLLGITRAFVTASTQFVATNSFQTFNVTKGTNATIRFDNLECHEPAFPHFTLRYKSEELPFCCRSQVHNTLINAGLREQDQEGRFSVAGLLANNTFSVILNIIDASFQDSGSIEMVFTLLNNNENIYVTRVAMVNVILPPPKAKCHPSKKPLVGHHYHVLRCQAPAENGKVTLSCFLANSKIIPIDIITDNNHMIRGTYIFRARFGDQVQCCSHLSTDDVTQETCDHSIFHHPKSITTPFSNNSSLEATESSFHLDSRRTTDIGSTNSSAQVCVLMSWIPLYLRVIIVAYISLSSLMYSEFRLNRPNAI